MAVPRVRPEILRIAQLEAQRQRGVADLVALSRSEDADVRLAAVRGLGRVGGPQAAARLVELLAEADERLQAEAARALGIAGVADAAPAIAAAYRKMKPSGTRTPFRFALVEALGRIGGEHEIETILEATREREAVVRAAATEALGRYGRRRLPIGAKARARLVELAGDLDVGVRYGVAYALGHEVPPARSPAPGRGTPAPPRDRAAEAALLRLADAPEPEIRAVAIAALAARGARLERRFVAALDDPDWRVRVQAVRALSGDRSTESMRAWLAAWLVNEWFAIGDLEARLLSPAVHPVHEGLARLEKHGGEKHVAPKLEKLLAATEVAESTEKARYSPEMLRRIDAVHCLAAAALVRAGRRAFAVLAGCGEDGDGGWPRHERIRLAAAVVGEGAGGLGTEERIAWLLDHWKDPDPRVRAHVASAATRIDDPRAARIVREALADRHAAVVGSTADALAERAASGRKPPANLLDALVERARVEKDVELRLALREALRRAGLGGAESPPADDSRPPPVDPARLLGRRVRLTLATSRGEVAFELDPLVAPWNVATLVTLAERGFYDGTIVHRVVPDFVVQGGDPTGSGWGGPGFLVPAEQGPDPYERGVVGIADAGLDTGGSQWFVVHSRAPHLDGRYTIVGRVVAGMDVIDSLVVGDEVKKAWVTLAP